MLTTSQKITKVVNLVAKAIGTTPEVLVKPSRETPPAPLTRAILGDARKILARILHDDVQIDFKRMGETLGWRHSGASGVYYYYDLSKTDIMEAAYQAVRAPALRAINKEVVKQTVPVAAR